MAAKKRKAKRPESRAGAGGSAPPAEHRFKPGVCPNPGGLPAWVKEVRELAGAHSREAIERLVTLMRQKKQLKVAHAAACAILDRAGAKPIQPIALTDADGRNRPAHDLSKLSVEELVQLEAALKKSQTPAADPE